MRSWRNNTGYIKPPWKYEQMSSSVYCYLLDRIFFLTKEKNRTCISLHVSMFTCELVYKSNLFSSPWGFACKFDFKSQWNEQLTSIWVIKNVNPRSLCKFCLLQQITTHWELISAVSFDTCHRESFLSSPSKLFDGITLQSNRVASDCKLQSAEQVAVSLQVEHNNVFSPCLLLCLFVQCPWSLSRSLSSQHSKLQKDFYSPLGSIISEKNKTHSQPNLLVKKLLVFHRFSLCPRFLVILLPAQMSPLMMFLIHTMLHALWDPASLVSTFFSSLFWWMSHDRALSLNPCCVLSLDK